MNGLDISLISKTFIRIISKVLNNDYNHKTDENLLTINEWESLFMLATKHDLAHLLCIAHAKEKWDFGEKINQKFIDAGLSAIVRYEQLSYEYKAILDTFTKEKIPFIPLKGAVLREYYIEPWYRTSCDIDILVRKEDLDRAVKSLVESNNYKADKKVNYHDVSLFSPSGVHLELHFRILENQENVDELLSKVWDYAYLIENSCCEYRLTPEFLIFYMVAHMLYHFIEGGCGVRAIIDLWFVHNKLEFDKEVLKGYVENCGINKFYESIVKLANVWFGNDEHTEVTLKLEKYVINGGVYGSLKNRMKVVGVNNNNNKKYALKRIFCPYSIMKNRYPILQKHKYLLPIFEIVRWYETIVHGKAKKLKNEIEILSSSSKAEKEEFKKFLTELGL